MSVNAHHPQYDSNVERWQLVRDVVNSNVKQYIKDIEQGEKARNDRYKDDARLTNFTSRTKNGLVGAVFAKPVVIDLPESVEYLKDDATGAKMGIEKLSQETTGEVLQAGRFGLLVDYPASEDGLTAAEVASMNLKARISKYRAESIINWQHEIINGQYVLTLVVLKECGSKIGEDGFSWVNETQYRVLRLLDGVYTQFIYDEKGNILKGYEPRDFNGNTWDFIPFVFVGAEDNDSEVDVAPLYDLAELNIGHLRNSADYEESVHVTGQPTLIVSTDMSAEQFKAANPNGVQIGARKGHNLGPGGNAVMLQANPNQLADEAMKRKEEQAVMIGARLVQSASANETAEAARIKHSGENSVLASIVDNVEDAIRRCIQWCMIFSEAQPNFEEIVFEINKTFFEKVVDAQLIMAQLQLFNNGIIAQADIRSTLRETGIIKPDRTDEEIDLDVTNVDPINGGLDLG